MFAGLVKKKDEDWIWEAMNKNPENCGFNRLDSTCLKAKGETNQRKRLTDY